MFIGDEDRYYWRITVWLLWVCWSRLLLSSNAIEVTGLALVAILVPWGVEEWRAFRGR
jgi:hypothetical protein